MGMKKLIKLRHSSLLSVAALTVLSACVSPPSSSAPPAKSNGKYSSPVATSARPQPPVYRPSQGVSGAPQGLRDELSELWRTFPGKTGIAVRKIDSGPWTISFRGNDAFPQQSVSKLWVTLTILEQIDQGRLSYSTPVQIGLEDLAVFYSPTRDTVVSSGAPVSRTIDQLIQYAITKSDNTANDVLLWRAGGPDAVRSFLARKQLGAIRFGPGERQLQSGIAGMTWQQSYSIGNRFFEARDKVPYETRRRALSAYLADPVDGAAPDAIVLGLDRLARGELLSPASTRYALDTLSRTSSGPNRLKAGVPAGWSFIHKTGTGQQLDPIATGYNDVGIMTAPDGTRYAVAVLIADTTASVPERMRLMQAVSRAVGRYHGY